VDRDVQTLNYDVDVLGSRLDQLVVEVFQLASQNGTDPSLEEEKTHLSQDDLPEEQQKVILHDFSRLGQFVKTGH
jgi:hypothetical protein